MGAAANFGFPGGIEKIEIADADDFDTSGNANFLVTMQRNQIASEGIDFPDPEKVTLELADDRRVANGIDQELSLRFTNMEMTDFQSLETARNDGTEVWIKVVSTATDGSGNPKWEVVYNACIIDHASHSPANADRESYGVVMVDAMTTGYKESDIMSITQN
jgi:hypothetical protein